jgi:methionyl-tRNA formyltransferase
MPPMGTINVHASLLPQYRGAAPINWTIINGEKETGITTFKLQQEIDTGNILLQEKIAIGESETAVELHDKLKDLGASLIVKTIEAITNGSLNEVQQSAISNQQSAIKHAPKLTTDTCKIDWNNKADDIYNLIRGLSPYPSAFTYLNGKVLKIYFGEKEIAPQHHPNGSAHSNGKTYLKFACADGFIHCTDIQLQGKKRMNIHEFLRGYRIHI